MRRVQGLWSEVVSFPNLLRAARRAARGKRRVAAVARFLERLEPECLGLQRALIAQTWVPEPAVTFTILDPKERVITAAPFRDRVVHHAVIDVLEPHLERRMIHESFACRRGKGTHAALDHAQHLVRRFPWFLKLDVQQFFQSLHHDVVFDTLARVVKDKDVLDLVRRILRGPVDSGGGTPVGLPIGHLTSQWLANLVLDRLDHHVKEVMRVRGYVRYMDDFALFASGKSALHAAHGAVEAFLGALRLQIKPRATILAPTSQGLPFLGWRLYASHRRLRPENRSRTWRRLKTRLWQARQGVIDEERLAASVASVVAHVSHGSTHALRRAWFDRLQTRSPP